MFFFSSRRRHTRCSRDWSSDVCSSDLSVPGFDEVVRKIYGFFGERGIRLLFQADAVRVGPTQFPRLNQLYADVVTSMDRSEEHTSELQSRLHLVCRLLLEKKKILTISTPGGSTVLRQ